MCQASSVADNGRYVSPIPSLSTVDHTHAASGSYSLNKKPKIILTKTKTKTNRDISKDHDQNNVPSFLIPRP